MRRLQQALWEEIAMKVVEFLADLSKQGVTLWNDGNQLRYQAPRGVMTASLRATLAEYKEELLIALSQGQHNTTRLDQFVQEEKPSPHPSSLLPVVRTQEIPLSFAQQSLWFLDQLHAQSTAYMVPAGLRLSGSLNIHALERSLVELVRRHHILRTTFVESAGQPVQVIHEQCNLPFPLVNMCRLVPEERMKQVHLLSKQEVQKPRDLTQGPLLSIRLVQLDVEEYVLLLIMHHLIGDAWSFTVVCLDELSKLYAAFSAGLPSPLVDLPIQYADFAVWQRKRSQKESMKEQLKYWMRQLDGIVPLELPTDHPRPSLQTFHGANQSYLLPLALVHKIKDFNRREGVTLFMTLLAALKTLLFRYTGQTDVALGTTIANRHLPEINRLIGFFANTLVMRTQLADNLSFRTLLRNVREVVIKSITNQEISFEEIVAELQPERQLSHPPLFQVSLTLHDPLPKDIYLGDIRAVPFAIESGTAKFDLAFEIRETDQGLDITLEYNTDLFEAATIHRLITSYETLLSGIVADPDQHLSDLPLLREADRNQLIVTWNATHTEEVVPQSLLLLFEQQVLHTPDALAVMYEYDGLTYHELNMRSNQLAHYLRQTGIEPEMLIGVCMERSFELLIALLAILKAGGVYVPLDPSYPAERLAWICEDAHLVLVLTQAHVASIFFSAHIQCLCINTQRQLWSSHPGTNPPHQATPKHLAYVIYTSGSTGRPKGAMIEHQGMLNHLFAKVQDLTLTSADRVAQTASLSFDISVWQLLSALLVGGCTIIYSQDLVYQPARLIERMQVDQISIFETVPSFLQAMLDIVGMEAQKQHPLSHLRWVVPTGEALSPQLTRRWFEAYPDIPLLNAYGPTECSDDVTSYRLSQPPASVIMQVPIGRPVRNMRMYVLDHRLMPLPIGTAGELYVGGIGVGRGYLNDPQRSSDAFVPNPFALEPGERLYKTGDRVRYQPDGNLVFLGRIDHQIKIRGYRIELGEIEAAIMKHAAVREVVVRLYEESAGIQSLVAYMVEEKTKILLSIDDLRSYLQGKLPEYMVPAFFVLLEAFPLTANGKIDLRSLPAPTKSRLDANERRGGVARTPIEEILLAIYCEVLGIEQVNIHDSFFHLGGHSLLATQVIARIRKVLYIEIPLRFLFEAPSIAGLAQLVEKNLRGEQERAIPPLVSIARDHELPLSFAQQRLWLQEQLSSGLSAYTLPLVLELQGKLQTAILEKSLREIVQRHESLRTTFVSHLGSPVQIVNAYRPVYISCVDLRTMEQNQQQLEIARLLHMEMIHPFDLAHGPLLRIGLLHVQDQKYVLYIIMHHIIFDAWSADIFLRELSLLYTAFLQGNSSPLPAPAFQYADFAHWQREWLKGEILNSLANYWTKQLNGANALEIPTDYPREATNSNRGGVHIFTFPPLLKHNLNILSHQEGVTLFMTLLAAFQILLYYYTEQPDIVVGTDIANRTHTETEEIIGFFVNLLVLRTQLKTQDTFLQILKNVRAMVLDAYAHQDLPFDALVDALRPRRIPHRVPLVNVLFVMQNDYQSAFHVQDFTAVQMSFEVPTAKFDVAVFLMEDATELKGFVNYRTDLFHPDTIARLIHHFEILLQSIVTSSNIPIETLEMFTEKKEQQMHKRDINEQEQGKKLKKSKRRMIPLPDSGL